MKHQITKIFTALAATVALLSSCSNIAEDERLIYVEPAKAARNVLIEDFTGQRCVNCPEASRSIKAIKEVYGDAVIPVAIHCGPYGFAGNANTVGLMTETGKEYWDNWFESTQGQPVAKINRGEANNDYMNWSSLVAKAMEQETDVQISATATYDSNSRQVDINTTTLAPAGKKAKLQLWITEDDIVALQLDGSTTVRDYVHEHVFRAAVNGTWGEDIVYGSDILTKHHTITLADNWVPEHCNIVIFVYSDNGVDQVISIPAVNNAE